MTLIGVLVELVSTSLMFPDPFVPASEIPEIVALDHKIVALGTLLVAV